MVWINKYTWQNQFKEKPILVITFDDGRPSDYQASLNARGIHCTSYIKTGSTDTVDHLSWMQVKDMIKRGWDIQCHTHTHPNLTTLTEQQVRGEIENVDAAFLANGLATPIHHANPYGGTNSTVRAIIADYRITQRAGLGGPYGFAEIDFQRIGTIAMDMQTLNCLNTVKQAIANAYAQKKILIGYLHRLVDNVTHESQCVKEYFWTMVDYALSLGINIWTIDAMYNYVSYVNSM